jgi:hypothetical protein
MAAEHARDGDDEDPEEAHWIELPAGGCGSHVDSNSDPSVACGGGSHFFDPAHMYVWKDHSSGFVCADGSTLAWGEGNGFPVSCAAVDDLIPVAPGHADLDAVDDDGGVTIDDGRGEEEEDFDVLPRDARRNTHEGIRVCIRINGEISAVGVARRKDLRANLRHLNSDDSWWLSSDGIIHGQHGDPRNEKEQRKNYRHGEGSTTMRLTFAYDHRRSSEQDPGSVVTGRLVIENLTTPGPSGPCVVSEDIPPGCVPFVALWTSGARAEIESIELLPAAGRHTKSAWKR